VVLSFGEAISLPLLSSYCQSETLGGLPMLVLTRRDGETIRLRLPNGDEIEVTLISGGPCKLGISAPDDVEVVRTEIAE